MERVKAKKDSDHNHRNEIASKIPTFFLQWIISIASYITMNMGLQLSPLGLKKNALGHCIMTNIGSIKIAKALAPISFRAPLLFAVGQVADKPVVVEEQILVQQMMSVCMTVDTRLMNMKMFHPMHEVYIEYLTDPVSYLAKHAEASHLKIN